MPLTVLFNPLQQPLQHGGPSSESHDPPSGLHDSPAVVSVHPNPDPPGWKKLIGGPLTTHERATLIVTIFSNRDEIEVIKQLCGDEAQTFVDVIYEALGDLDYVLRMRCLRFLHKICGRQALLPKPLVIQASYDRTEVPPCHGGFSDVWKGVSCGQEVAIKVLKVYQSSNYEQIRKRFCEEVVMWSTLCHPNVLPLLGVMMTDTQFSMVSEWMVNGNISGFVKVHPDVDRLELLADVVRGLVYLHNQEMIHGDLKGPNILIDHDGHARIADFGLLTIISDQANFISSISHLEGGTTRWMSPELLDPESFDLEDSRPTKESDIYALGMVVYEVLSGQAPFPRCKDAAVIRKVMRGERPERPQGVRGAWFKDGLWEILELCWKPQRGDRPSLKTLLQCLEGADVESGVQITQILNTITAPPKDLPPILSPMQVADNCRESLSVLSQLPPLPQAPANCFSREEIMEELLDLVEQVASVTLSGQVGVGKSSVALTLLHHDRIKVKFGRSRYFMRCDDLTNSFEGFLERLSDALDTNRTTDIMQLRSHLEASPKLILLLDGVDFILDPLAPDAEKISATIEEFGCYQQICLLTTSRMDPEIPGFRHVKVPTLSEDAARDAFHGLCNLGRSSVVDTLLNKLDFHPLSIDIFASFAHENGWDDLTLLRALDDDQANVLKTKYYQHLGDAIERSFRSPTLQSLGDAARGALAVIACFPCGVRESELEGIVPGMAGVGEAVDVLCMFSLVYRQEGFVKMLSPVRSYFLESALEPTQHVEVIRWDDNMWCSTRGNLPIFVSGPPDTKPPRVIRRLTGKGWIKRLRSMKKTLLVLFGRPRGPANFGNIQVDPANASFVPVQQSLSAQVAYEIE